MRPWLLRNCLLLCREHFFLYFPAKECHNLSFPTVWLSQFRDDFSSVTGGQLQVSCVLACADGRVRKSFPSHFLNEAEHFKAVQNIVEFDLSADIEWNCTALLIVSPDRNLTADVNGFRAHMHSAVLHQEVTQLLLVCEHDFYVTTLFDVDLRYVFGKVRA